MKAIQVENPGPDYRLVLNEIPTSVPGKHEILIKVAAAGVNRADLHQRQGKYPVPAGASPIIGLELSGPATRRGPCGAGVRPPKPLSPLHRSLTGRRPC